MFVCVHYDCITSTSGCNKDVVNKNYLLNTLSKAGALFGFGMLIRPISCVAFCCCCFVVVVVVFLLRTGGMDTLSGETILPN